MTEQEIEQLIDKEATKNRQTLDYVQKIVSERANDFENWCLHRQRLKRIAHETILAVFFISFTLSYSVLMAKPLYEQITTNGNAQNQHVCDEIQNAIQKI